MFKKLRWKLALTNAAVAAVILIAISAAAYFMFSWIVTRQSQRDLNTITTSMIADESSGRLSAFKAIQLARSVHPYLFIRMDQANNLTVANSGLNLTNDQITELVNKALENEQNNPDTIEIRGESDNYRVSVVRRRSDIIRLGSGQSFRYNISGLHTGAAVYFVFLDMSSEEYLLHNVLLALLGCVVGGLILTIAGGLFLAERSLRPIKAAWQKQRNFVADASHELRSPLAAIRCSLDVVLDDPAAPVAEKQLFWEGIVEETDRMSRLVDELLLLARADSGVMMLQKDRVALADVAESAVGFLRPLADKKAIHLTLEIKQSPTVTGDHARLKQVLIALIDNAVKYTPEGGHVTVCVDAGKDKAAIEIEDTGIGIAKEHLKKIFDRFYRVDSARGRESGGHGLGLSIARWIVEQHGGRITVTSEADKGSRFTVQLPLSKE